MSEEDAAEIEIAIRISMEEIEDEDLLTEFYRRWPRNAEDEIKTLVETRDVQDVDAAIIAQLRAWLKE